MASDFSGTTVEARSGGTVHSKLWPKINSKLEFAVFSRMRSQKSTSVHFFSVMF